MAKTRDFRALELTSGAHRGMINKFSISFLESVI